MRHRPKKPVLETIFSDKSLAKHWVEKNGDPKNVYLLEAWLDERRLDVENRECVCDWCQIFSVEKRSWTLKWCWDPVKLWHLTSYAHESEVSRSDEVPPGVVFYKM